MKGWKKLSIYHVLKNRWDCRFINHTAMDYFSGICGTDGLTESSLFISGVLAAVISFTIGLSFLQYIALDLTIHAIIAGFFSAVDTYYMRKIQIRRETMKSIELMIGMVDRKRWP